MSKATKRKLGLFAAGAGFVSLVLVGLNVGFYSPAERLPMREIRLVAREMAFYLEGNSKPNPLLQVQARQKIRLYFSNLDPGMIHDVVFPALDLATQKIAFGESAQLEFEVEGSLTTDYLCSLHAAMMKGEMRVALGK